MRMISAQSECLLINWCSFREMYVTVPGCFLVYTFCYYKCLYYTYLLLVHSGVLLYELNSLYTVEMPFLTLGMGL